MIVREAREEELSDIFMMGFDTWGDGDTQDTHIKKCLENTKYDNGTWFVLEENKEAVSSLIVYKNAFNLPENCLGIGSVATPPKHRKKGYASALIREVLKVVKEHSTRGIYLFSDIDPLFYRKFGFEPIAADQSHQDTNCMVLVFNNSEDLSASVPDYF